MAQVTAAKSSYTRSLPYFPPAHVGYEDQPKAFALVKIAVGLYLHERKLDHWRGRKERWRGKGNSSRQI